MEHEKRITSRKDALIFLVLAGTVLIASVAILIHSFLTNHNHTPNNTISEIISNPTAWENKPVKVEGTIQRTAIGIIRPFNYWLSDRANQTTRIGVKWHSGADLSGKNVEVIGVIRRGYAWVHPDHPGWWVYFIEAKSFYVDAQNFVKGTGTIVFLHFEGGFCGIISDDGGCLDPINLDPEFEVEGLRVYFEAKIVPEAVSYHMWGIIVEILKIQRLE